MTLTINHLDRQGGLVVYHTIDFNKSTSMFRWSSDEVTFIAKQNKNSVSLQVNGVYADDPSKLTRTENSLKAATYVFWQPFKLIDPKAIISSKRIRTLFNDWEVYELEVLYPNSEDQWHFHFDTKIFLFKATGVLFKKRYSLIVNDLQENDTGLKLNAKRTSYSGDKNFNPNRIKTKYRYEITLFNDKY